MTTPTPEQAIEFVDKWLHTAQGKSPWRDWTPEQFDDAAQIALDFHRANPEKTASEYELILMRLLTAQLDLKMRVRKSCGMPVDSAIDQALSDAKAFIDRGAEAEAAVEEEAKPPGSGQWISCPNPECDQRNGSTWGWPTHCLKCGTEIIPPKEETNHDTD